MSDTATPVPADLAPADEYLVPEEATSEGFRFLDNGLVVAFVDGTRHLLRRPKAREYRDLRSKLEAHQDEMMQLANDVADSNARAVEGLKPNERPPIEVQLAVRAKNRELNARIEANRRQWMRSVFDLLASPALEVDVDDEPVWFSNDAAAVQLINHWQRVPSLRGGR